MAMDAVSVVSKTLSWYMQTISTSPRQKQVDFSVESCEEKLQRGLSKKGECLATRWTKLNP